MVVDVAICPRLALRSIARDDQPRTLRVALARASPSIQSFTESPKSSNGNSSCCALEVPLDAMASSHVSKHDGIAGRFAAEHQAQRLPN